MDRAEAIKVLDDGDWWGELDEWYMDANPEFNALHDAIDLAIAALREQEQREQGCEFCLNGEHLSALFYDKYGDRLDFTFCPMCGRKLSKEGADHE